MRALATGDFHINERGGLGPERLADFEQVWNRIVDLALQEDVDAVLLAGDIWEHRAPTPAELVAFAKPLRRLRAESRADILAITGNHCVSHADRPTGLDLFTGSLDLHRTPGLWRTGGVTVATLPWTPVSRVVAAAGGGDRDGLFDRAAALLLATARGLRQEIDGPAVLLAHWAVSGASTPDGLATELFREPVLDVGELEGQGWDAVVLGHVHKPQLLGSEDAAGPMLYVGSPLPLTHGEAACDHGVWIYDTEGLPSARFLPVSSRRFVTLDYGDLAAEANGNIAGLVALSDGLGWDPPLTDAIVRLRYTSTEEQARGIDTAALKRALLDAGAWRATVEPRIVREQTARVAGMTSDLDPARALELYLAERGVEDRDGLLALHQEYMAEIA